MPHQALAVQRWCWPIGWQSLLKGKRCRSARWRAAATCACSPSSHVDSACSPSPPNRPCAAKWSRRCRRSTPRHPKWHPAVWLADQRASAPAPIHVQQSSDLRQPGPRRTSASAVPCPAASRIPGAQQAAIEGAGTSAISKNRPSSGHAESDLHPEHQFAVELASAFRAIADVQNCARALPGSQTAWRRNDGTHRSGHSRKCIPCRGPRGRCGNT